MGSTVPAVFLPWDSEFFDLRIARVQSDRLDAGELKPLEEWCADNGIDCLYFLADPDVPESLLAAEESGFRLVDIRISLHHVRGRYPSLQMDETAGYGLRALREEDIPVLMEIAGRIHQITRFWRDPGFPASRCSELYRRWLERDVTGRADRVLVCEFDGQPVGYITCILDPDSPGCGTISLLGVHEAHRHKGMGSRLLRGAIEWFGSEGAGTVNVVTQGTNISSLRVYQEAGFLIDSVRVWFHRWFG